MNSHVDFIKFNVSGATLMGRWAAEALGNLSLAAAEDDADIADMRSKEQSFFVVALDKHADACIEGLVAIQAITSEFELGYKLNLWGRLDWFIFCTRRPRAREVLDTSEICKGWDACEKMRRSLTAR